MAAIELIHEQPVRFIPGRVAVCDGGMCLNSCLIKLTCFGSLGRESIELGLIFFLQAVVHWDTPRYLSTSTSQRSIPADIAVFHTYVFVRPRLKILLFRNTNSNEN